LAHVAAFIWRMLQPSGGVTGCSLSWLALQPQTSAHVSMILPGRVLPSDRGNTLVCVSPCVERMEVASSRGERRKKRSVVCLG